MERVARDIKTYTHCEPRTQLLVDVHATTRATGAGVDHDARFLPIVDRHEIARLVYAARGGQQCLIRRQRLSVQLVLPIIELAIRVTRRGRRSDTDRPASPVNAVGRVVNILERRELP